MPNRFTPWTLFKKGVNRRGIIPLLNCMTRGNIEYNLKKSPFVWEWNHYEFFFSSQSGLNKFIKAISGNPENQLHSISNLLTYYGKNLMVQIEPGIITFIRLYQKIEKRGFYITYQGKELKCLPV